MISRKYEQAVDNNSVKLQDVPEKTWTTAYLGSQDHR